MNKEISGVQLGLEPVEDETNILGKGIESKETDGEQEEVPEAQESVDSNEQEDTQSEADETESSEDDVLAPYINKMSKGEELTDDDLGSIADKLGTNKEVVEYTYLGMKAKQAEKTSAALEVVGGMDAYQEMTKWAAGTYSAEEIKAFNEALDSGDDNRTHTALRTLKEKFTAVNGTPSSTVEKSNKKTHKSIPASAPTVAKAEDNTASGNNEQSFRSMEEQRAAQQDPRYGKDVAYTKSVYLKIAKSNY